MKNLKNLSSVIQEHPFFKGMQAEYIDLLVGCAKNVRFKQGSFLLRQAEPADTFYLIREGQVSVEIHSADQGAQVIQTLTAGDIVGWSWLVPPYRIRFDCRATTSTVALAFDAKCLRQKCEKNNQLGYDLLKRLMKVYTERLEAARIGMLDIYSSSKSE